MKLILTENQINFIKEREIASSLLEESLFKRGKLDRIVKTIKKMLYMGIAVATIVAVINKQDIDDETKNKLIEFVKQSEPKIEDSDEFKIKLDACRKYMAIALKNQGFSFNSTGLKPETLVKASIETGFDLPFLMAAAHQESCFGAASRSRRTNSVFNVGSYDDGRNVVTYSDPNDSVYGYIDLLNSDYLVDGKTIHDLLKPGRFVNYDNKRYASDKGYERKIKNLRNKILRNYPELT